MYKAIKRLFDFLFAFVGILILSPIFVALAIILGLQNKGTPFFLQLRPGKKERLFKIIKFKTMTDETDTDNNLLPDKDRITKIGSFTRKSSFDEIPQLINVIMGDMSLVGPRPLLPEYLSLYSQEQKLRHNVRPGITGWAQINGRNAITWSKKLELDAWYVKNQNFLLDLKILIFTVKKVIIKDGISSDNNVTIDRFTGQN